MRATLNVEVSSSNNKFVDEEDVEHYVRSLFEDSHLNLEGCYVDDMELEEIE